MKAARGDRWSVDARPRLRLAQPGIIDLQAEAAYWRACCRRGLFDTGGLTYADFAPAFRMGVELYLRVPFGDTRSIEPLAREWWRRLHGVGALPWNVARRACLAAWSDLALGHWQDEEHFGDAVPPPHADTTEARPDTAW